MFSLERDLHKKFLKYINNFNTLLFQGIIYAYLTKISITYNKNLIALLYY